MSKHDLLEQIISKNYKSSEIDKKTSDDLFNNAFTGRYERLSEEEFNDVKYDIKYSNVDNIKKFEDYLTRITFHDLNKMYHYSFINNRENVKITDMNSNISITIDIDSFIHRIGKKIKIFLKFKDIDKK